MEILFTNLYEISLGLGEKIRECPCIQVNDMGKDIIIPMSNIGLWPVFRICIFVSRI